MQIEFLEPAREEFQEAVVFYDNRKAGLGSEFAEEVRKAIARIIPYPEAWSPISRRTRRCRVNRFPFGVIYQVLGNTLLIIAIMHLHQEPNSWRDRLR